MREEGQSLTRNEWAVMELLWQAPRTLMELVAALGADPGWAKSTTTTMVRRMEAKGLIRHEAGRRAKIFYPALSRDQAALVETRSLLDKVFSGSVGMLVNTMARQNSLTRADIDALYQALREAEEGDK